MEDSPLFRTYLKDFLNSRYHFEIEELNSVRGLYYYLFYEGLDDVLLIILDVFLPDGNSLELIRRFREQHPEKRVPFIVVSGYLTRDLAEAALRAGARDLLTKPINTSKLVERIDQILSSEYKQERQQAITNHYHPVRQEIKRAQRGNYSLSLLLTGIFHQESLQPLHKMIGYPEGQQLRQVLLPELQKVMRETDTMVNLSTSEVLFILPFCDEEGAGVVQNKIRRAVKKILGEQLPAEKVRGSTLIAATAVYPQDGGDADRLIATLEEDYRERISGWAEQNQEESGLWREGERGSASGEGRREEGEGDHPPPGQEEEEREKEGGEERKEEDEGEEEDEGPPGSSS